MRGSTFKNSLCILDEAQNCTPAQMKLFLSRIGEDCKVIIDGDIAQTDIRGLSGLADAVDRLYDVDKIGIVKFEIDDIVRSEMCKEIILRYR
jgi:phosphate starvation-inducible PhoH-like protein